MNKFVKIGYIHKIKVGSAMLPVVKLVDSERKELYEYFKSNPVILQEYVADFLRRRPNHYGNMILEIDKKRKAL